MLRPLKRNILFTLLLIICCNTASAQQDIINTIVSKTDTILTSLAKEKDPDKETQLIRSIYNTSIDGFPLLLLDVGQRLLAMGRERKDLVIFELVFPGESDVQYEAVEVVVYRLRKKLSATGVELMTLRGLGYLLKAQG